MILRLRSISSRRAALLLFAAALIAAVWFVVASIPGKEYRTYPPSALEHAIESRGVKLAPLPPSDADPSIRGVAPQRFAIGLAQAAVSQQETVTIYVFPTAAERSKGEGELRTAAAARGELPPIVYERRNLLVWYRPLAVVNHSGTKYGELLQGALDSL